MIQDNINIPRLGMNRDVHPMNLKESHYTIAFNTLYEGRDGGGFPMLQNEPSNLLCSRYPDGFKLIGFKVDVNENKLYLFLTNPDTGESQIGCMNISHTITNIEEVEHKCGCNYVIDLGTPLEEITQTPYCTYEVLLQDDCNNCLNFSIDNPIFNSNIWIKDEKCGKSIYWTDGFNPPRYLNLDNLDQYGYIGEEECDEEPTATCLDCDKLRIFKDFKKPCITPVVIEYGGNLKQGVYEFLVAYSDKQGNELSQYYSITQNVSIFDFNQVTIDPTEIDSETNLGIRLSIDGLDTRYSYYKVAVIQRADVNNTTSYLFEGVHLIDDNTVTYYTDKDKQRTTLNNLLKIRPNYKTSQIMTASNGYLFQAGLTAEKEVNLQPVVNLLGSFLKWNTHIAKETLYRDGVNNAKYRGYMRDEVYPFSIKFFFEDGTETANFILPNRPPNANDLEVVDNMDTNSIADFSKSCVENPRIHRWQYYNTASKEGSCVPDTSDYFTEVTRNSTKTCKIPAVTTINGLEIRLTEDVEFTNFSEYFAINRQDFCNNSSEHYNLEICNVLTNTFPDSECQPFLEENCTDPVLTSEFIDLQEVVNEVVTLQEKALGDYEFGNYNTTDIIYLPGDDSGFTYDIPFMESYMNQDFPPIYTQELVYTRFNPGNNTSCTTALPLQTDFQNLQGTILQYDGGTSLTDITQSAFISNCVNGEFAGNVHTKAKWFKVDVSGGDKIILEVSPADTCGDTDDISVNGDLRINTFDSCTGGTSVQCDIFDIETGKFMELDPGLYTGNSILISIDSPYIEKNRVTDTGATEVVYIVTPPCKPISVNTRSVEIESTVVNIETLIFCKEQEYEVTCSYKIPNLGNCDTIPFEFGRFGYYESTDKYPCNDELYDSSVLIVRPSDLPDEIRDEFVEHFVSGTDVDGVYELNNYSNLSDNVIRHYRFPDNCLSAFMEEESLLPFQESNIYPIGVSLDVDTINAFLDLAVANELITLERRSSITKYEIFRGDRTLDRSIIAKGLSYDMYKYDEQGDPRYYPNYPYNALGDDNFNYQTNTRQDLIEHPYGSTQNTRYTFHSPDTHFRKPTLPNEVHIEGYQLGNSRGKFSEVDGHSEWVILGEDAYTIALTLAIAESVFETAIIVGEAWLQASQNFWFQAGLVVGGNPIGSATSSGFAIAISVATAIAQATYKVGQYRYEWLKILRENGKTRNFGYYYTSEGYYNRFLCNEDFVNELNNQITAEGNQIRGTSAIRYIKQGNYKINDLKTGDTATINNYHRESSVYISFSELYPFQYDPTYLTYDNVNTNNNLTSRFPQSDTNNCTKGISPEYTRNIGSPYMSLRNYRANQYGKVNSIKWLNTSYCGDLLEQNDCDTIFGGDTFISRFSLKRKFPFFYTNAVGLADLTPFEYYSQRNVGYPRFYCNFSTSERTGLAGAIFPDIGDDYSFDCLTGDNKVYVRPPSKMYLFSYGIPQFLVESEVNNNYRYARKEYHENFYPNVGDYVDWTQEENVSIKLDNEYYYNFAYSKNVSRTVANLLPSNFDKELYDCLYDAPNGVIYSLQDNSEQDLNDPWLVYRPLDFYQFKTSAGRLIDLRDIESSQILGRFENQIILFNAIDNLRDRLTPNNQELGNAGIFATRPLEFKRTDLGYAGTQHKAMISCEFGHFWADARRGEVFQLDQNGRNLREITQGLRNWFKEQLPFKILGAGITGLTEEDLDNSYKGLGITMGWDSRFSRVFLTKLDYKLRNDFIGRVSYTEGTFVLDDGTELQLTDSTYFIDCSFTVAYSPLPHTQSWISYYSFKPNYYISHNNYFQTGVNYSSDVSEGGLWSHLITDKSYQVFYGKKRDWYLEYPVSEKFNNSYLRSIEYWMDSRRYHNNHDFSEHRCRGFNKAWIYNNSESSGLLNLKLHEKNNLSQLFQNKTQYSYSRDILVTENDKKWTFNSFFNRVRDEKNNQPLWFNDCNYIQKTINEKSLDYYQNRLDRLRGDWFLVRLLQDSTTQFKFIFKWDVNKQTYYKT